MYKRVEGGGGDRVVSTACLKKTCVLDEENYTRQTNRGFAHVVVPRGNREMGGERERKRGRESVCESVSKGKSVASNIRAVLWGRR